MGLALKDLRTVRKLLYSVRRKWYDIGIELGLDINELDSIRKAYPDDDSKCLVDMIKLWLKCVDPLPTWKALGDALKEQSVDEQMLAKDGKCSLV